MAQAEKLNPGVAGYESIANEAIQAARKGMSAQEYNRATTNIERSAQGTLGQLGRMPNPLAGILSAQRNKDDALLNLTASNEGIKRQNRAASFAAQAQLQQARQQQYSDAYNAAQALMGAGQQNTAGSFGALGQYGMMQSIYGDRTQYQNKNRTAAAIPSAVNQAANTPATTPSYSVPGLPSFMQGKFGGYMGGGYYGRINPLTGLPE